MLYIFENIDLLEDSFAESIKRLLSYERITKIQRLKSPQSKNASTVVYLLLRLALQDMYSINETVEFNFLDKGKPVLRDYPDIHFNLSHSYNLSACAIADAPVGVDVQKIKKISDKAARRVLTDEEFIKLTASDTPEEYFTEIWAIKESFLKRSGQGIATELRDVSAESIKEIITFRAENYFCSVCGPFIQEIQIKHIRREDFEQLSN